MRRSAAIVRCAVDLGLRGAEIAMLTLDDIDWEAGTLTLRRTKSRREQVLPLPEPTGRAIAAYLEYERPKSPHREVFVRRKAPLDETIRPDLVRKTIRQAYEGAGLPYTRSHLLRHTIARRLRATELAEPEEVMSVLRQYHNELGNLIMKHDGTIEHLSGDGMIIMFNAPLPVEDHEFRAIGMALAMRAALSELSSSWRKRGHELGFRVGIASGYATIGTIGFEQRLDYGAIGQAPDMAARLCGESKDMQILIAPRVFAKVEGRVEVEAVGNLMLKGFHRPIPAYNVIGLRDGGGSK